MAGRARALPIGRRQTYVDRSLPDPFLAATTVCPSPNLEDRERADLHRYPSLLESSDADGGSSVAVLTYLRHVLDALDHPELVHMILQYLLALIDYTSGTSREPRSPAAVKKRQSLMLLSSAKEDEERLNPSLFNLVDLILGSTSSSSPQTITAALKLTTVILGKNHGYALGSLVKVMNTHRAEPYRTSGSLNKELETYLGLAIDIAGLDGVNEAYENYLKDILGALESHPCSLKSISQSAASPNKQGYFDVSEVPSRDVDPHYLLPEDPLFQTLIDLLLTFLTNNVETNLALTEALVSLGTCSQLCLEGWLSVDPADYHFETTTQEPTQFSSDTMRNMYMAERAPSWSSSATPQLLACLQQLQEQIKALRNDIPDWDEHVANHKRMFRLHEEEARGMKLGTPGSKNTRQTSEASTGAWQQQIPRHVREGEVSATPSRTQSPRGRKEALSASDSRNSTERGTPRFGNTPIFGSPSRALSPLSAPQLHTRRRGPGTASEEVEANLTQLKHTVILKRIIRFRRVPAERKVEVLLSRFQPPPKDPEVTPVATAVLHTEGVGEAAQAGRSEDKEQQGPGVHEQDDAEAGKAEEDKEDIREASLMQILTNVVVLQDFTLELVALIQVRASLFGEVRFA